MRKGWLGTILLSIMLIFFFSYKEDIAKVVMQKVTSQKETTLPDSNNYDNNISFQFVQKTDDFHVKNYQNLLNVIYTILSNGTDEFTFYCDESYSECMNDFDKVSRDQVLLSTINNMVSPYNSYEKVYFKSTNYGMITMSVDKQYSSEDIDLIEGKINEFIANNINDEMSAYDKIKAFHDYVINNSVYDKERATAIENGNDTSNSSSHKANGPLIDGIGLCSGYSDAMKIYLDKLSITSYKISNTNHIWNLVYINGGWLHLDLTWDDPVTNTGDNLLLHKFFLIDTNTLFELDSAGHNYNSDYYLEVSH